MIIISNKFLLKGIPILLYFSFNEVTNCNCEFYHFQLWGFALNWLITLLLHINCLYCKKYQSFLRDCEVKVSIVLQLCPHIHIIQNQPLIFCRKLCRWTSCAVYIRLSRSWNFGRNCCQVNKSLLHDQLFRWLMSNFEFQKQNVQDRQQIVV